MRSLGCWDDSEEIQGVDTTQLPKIEVSGTPRIEGEKSESDSDGNAENKFHARILEGATKGKLHDCLIFGKGLPHISVLSWAMMEWIPFKRMDLRDDGSWKPIRW